ncbi:hypothetical protein RRG08_017000 [Elysia crispata]|uniref:Uncharacterized protein n=1 Tax=Elysia crispata TaxID=231223 RepID=A0AAE1CPU1_9GAST|nr:hypothetical protein RRG08_017000 [Elysia crispata]
MAYGTVQLMVNRSELSKLFVGLQQVSRAGYQWRVDPPSTDPPYKLWAQNSQKEMIASSGFTPSQKVLLCFASCRYLKPVKVFWSYNHGRPGQDLESTSFILKHRPTASLKIACAHTLRQVS